MAAKAPIILILGAGSNIGQGVARAFASKGYRVAVAARSAKASEDTENQIHIAADFSNPESIPSTFAKVKVAFGIPSVVVYNVGAATRNPPNDPLSLPLADFSKDLTLNTISPFVAAQQAALGFAELPKTASRTFIYTGNILNTHFIIPPMMDLGVGKAATARFIHSASAAYKDRGFKFYYADERVADGSAAFSAIDGDAHGKHYLHLAEGQEQGPWQQTFVKSSGYKEFPAV